jgi:crotonobetainyl-CoA:carnitine CoA-transferase CaiB-like acyl-CoA transferase
MAHYAPQRMGTAHPNIAPYGDLFSCADGQELVLAVGSDAQFAALCDILGLAALAKDDRFANNNARLQNRSVLIHHLAKAIQTAKREDWLKSMQEHSVPAGAVLSIPEVFAQAAAQKLLLRQQLPDGRETVCVKTVVFTIQTSSGKG